MARKNLLLIAVLTLFIMSACDLNMMMGSNAPAEMEESEEDEMTKRTGFTDADFAKSAEEAGKEMEKKMMEEKTMTKEEDKAMEKNDSMMEEEKETLKMEEKTEENKAEVEAMEEKMMAKYENYSAEKVSSLKKSGSAYAIFFHAQWCPTCRGMESDINENLAKLSGNTIILKADFDTETDLKKEFNINQQSIVVIIGKDGKEITRLAAPSAKAIDEALNKA